MASGTTGPSHSSSHSPPPLAPERRPADPSTPSVRAASVMTSPDTPPMAAYPEGFQGDAIPIDADAVVRVVRMRLNNDEEADDG